MHFWQFQKLLTSKNGCHWQNRDKESDRRDKHLTQYNGNTEQCEWFQMEGHVTGVSRLKKEYSYTTTTALYFHGMLQGELSQKVHKKLTAHTPK